MHAGVVMVRCPHLSIGRCLEPLADSREDLEFHWHHVEAAGHRMRGLTAVIGGAGIKQNFGVLRHIDQGYQSAAIGSEVQVPSGITRLACLKARPPTTMQEMDPQSTRAQFTQVTTPGDVQSTVNHLPSPSMALELDTPRTVEVVTGDGVPTGAWAAGLFDCLDNLMPNCFMVTLCPCVALAQLSTRLGVASYRVVLSLLLFVTVVELAMFTLIWTTADDNEFYNYTWENRTTTHHDKVLNGTFVVITLIVQMLLFVYIWQLRSKTRARYQLPGSAVTDCLSSWFCSCCTVAQLRTHVRCYQPGNCAFGAPDVLQAYPGKSYAV